MTVFASVRLSGSGELAELSPDDLSPDGVVLRIGGAEQSHVERCDPQYLLHDYLRRMRSVLTAGSALRFRERGPGTMLHLGAGALTLPRWVASQWPDTWQTVVDYEPELVEFVLEHLPMEPAPESVVADAAEALEQPLAGRVFDVVVVDLFNSAAAAAHLRSAAFFQSLASAATGLILLNLGDDPGMSFARELVRDVLDATKDTVAGALLSAPDSVISGKREGNLVLALSISAGFSQGELAQIWAAGPHPHEVLSGSELQQWAQGTTGHGSS